MKVWIGRDQNGTYRAGLGDPPQPTIWPGPAGAARWWQRPGPTGSAQIVVVCPLGASRICDGLGISLEPGEAHAFELTALDYGWVMEEVSDE